MAVEILNAKSTYNKLELISGRMAQLKPGDVIVGALGHRKALFGYSGHLPESLKPGDEVQVLNIGGVLGICDSINANFGQPFNAKVLGAVLEFPILGERIGVPARAGSEPLECSDDSLNTHGVPVVALAGTCMDSGKTAAASARSSRGCGTTVTRSMPSRPPAYRCGGTSWPWKTPARATRRSSPTSA